MHAAFVYPGGPLVPDLTKATLYKITRLYWQEDDGQISADLLADMRRHVEVGLMFAPEWGGYSAVDFARHMDARLTQLGFSTSTAPRSCYVLADIEAHDSRYVAEWLIEWRSLRRTRATAWTLEPHQTGWWTPAMVMAVNGASVQVMPFGYFGDMSPVASLDAARCEIIEAGIPRERASLVYAARTIPPYWDGLAFPYHELP